MTAPDGQGLPGSVDDAAERERDAFLSEPTPALWPDMHPEDYCHRCGGRNVSSWWTDGEVWNAVMRPDGPDSPWLWNEIICPQCFAELFAQRFPNASWHLRLDPDTRGAQAFASREERSDG